MALNQKEAQSFNTLFTDILQKFDKSPGINSEVYFDITLSLKIIKKVTKFLKNEPNVLKINKNSKNKGFVIVGDIHGSLESLHI